MANRDSDAYTRQANRNVTRQYFPSLAQSQQQLFFYQQDYTIPAGVTIADGDKIRFPAPGIPGAVLCPELSRVSNIGAGDLDLDVRLYGVNTDISSGTVTETPLTSATASSIDNNSVAFARIATATAIPEIAADDYLMLLVSNYEAGAAAEVIRLELVFHAPKNIN